MNKTRKIILAHGGGGELTQRLLAETVIPRLANEFLNPLADSALLPRPGGRICMSTDSFVVQPLEFPGGDIGRLAVCGTVNDLAVMGARPLALSLGLILEEGLPLSLLERVVDSIARTAAEAEVPIVTGDTKVVEAGAAGGGLLINTTGIGELRPDYPPEPAGIVPGDRLLVSGNIAEHGLAVLSVRKHLTFDTDLVSDVAPLGGLIRRMLDSGAAIRFMRDPTRGGLAGVCADLAAGSGLSLEIDEASVPVSGAALRTAEILGLDPLGVANEGKVVVVVAAADAERALAACRSHPLGKNAALVGAFTDGAPPLVELITRGGGRRRVIRPYGEELPRIC